MWNSLNISFRLDNVDSSLLYITFHFYTDYIETETACQWQICKKKPLTCQISVHNELYINEKGLYKKKFYLQKALISSQELSYEY